MTAPFVIVSDVHLAHEGSAGTAEALAALVEKHPHLEIVLAGDIFGLSHDPPKREPSESLRQLLRAYPSLKAALSAHLKRGSRLSFIAGNHDAAVAAPRSRAALLAELGGSERAPLAVEAWFLRRGNVHVEHGHLWDPDNAPAHPLAVWSPATEPLGIALTRRFVAKEEVWQFAHAHETTLAKGLARAFRLFGARTPLLVASYFFTSGGICAETLIERGLAHEIAAGERELARLAAETGVAEAALRALLEVAPEPTHARFRHTFLRLYFDRVLAALTLVSGAFGFVGTLNPAFAGLSLAGAGYLGVNVKRSGARYDNRPVRLLESGAHVVRRLTGAELVVFGHTHVARNHDGYANAGSFGYAGLDAGRPYLVVDEHGRAELKRL